MPVLLQISIEVNSGSSGRIAEQLGQVAMAHGWSSYITFARAYQPSKSNVIKIGTAWNVYWHVLQTRLFDNHGFSSVIATKKLIRQIQEIKPDIIQLQQLHGYYLNLPLLFNFFTTQSTPVVWSLHDCWPMTGHCSHFALAGCVKWKTGCFKCPLLHDYPRSLLYDNSKQNFIKKKNLFTAVKNLTIVPTSRWIEGIVMESFLSQLPHVTITNGVDTDNFSPQKNTHEIKMKYNIHGDFIILGVGTEWSAAKGLYDYFKLRKRLPANYSIILVGLQNEYINTLPAGIIGIQRTESISELVQLYSAADVVTSLSYLETFGLTPVEGFACGTPAIVYNCTGLPELITPEVGYVVEPGNIDQIVEVVEVMRLKGKAYYSEACRHLALTKYNKTERYARYIDLYDELLRESHTGRK